MSTRHSLCQFDGFDDVHLAGTVGKEGEAVLEGHDVTGFGTAESHVGEYRRCRVVMAVVSVLAGPGAHVENAEPVGLADEDIAAIVGAVESGEPLDGKIPDLLQGLGVVDQHTAVVAQCESRCGTALFDRRSRRRTARRRGVTAAIRSTRDERCGHRRERGHGKCQFCPLYEHAAQLSR